MIHAISQSINARRGNHCKISQQDVRNAVASWLEANPCLNGELLSNFVHNMEWDACIEGVKSYNEWSDHLCLGAAAHIYRI